MGNQSSRRRFLQAAAVASGWMIAGFDTLTRSWVLEAQTTSGPFEKVPKLDGRLLYDEPSRSAVASDAGNIIHRMPVAVLKPASVQDVVSMVQFANQHSLKVAMRGQGHSSYGQSLVEAGIVIDSSTLDKITIHSDSIDAQAGAFWGNVAKVSLAKGLTPPVMLGDPTQTVTVGGSLSIGGMGNTCHRFGAQVDNVEELDVVTGDGRLVTCSPRSQTELFNVVLAGLGQCALIMRARIRLVPAYSQVMLYDLFYNDFETFRSDLKRLALDGRFDHLAGPIWKNGDTWKFTIGAGKFYTPPNEPDFNTLKAGLKFNSVSEPARMTYWDFLHRARNTATEGPGVSRRPEFGAAGPPVASVTEIGMFVPESAANEFIRTMLGTPSDLALAFFLEVCGLNTRRSTRPLFKMPDEDFALLVWIIDIAFNSSETSTMLAGHRSLYERLRAVGGKRYAGFGAVPFSPMDWEDHFGRETWRRLAAAKKKYDPKNILTPGPAIFA